MKIAVDAMGGDNAPGAIVQGGLDAARLANGRYEIVFVGDAPRIEAELSRYRFTSDLPVSVHHASEKIEMDEPTGAALRRKPDASIVVSQKLQRDGEVQAVVSAGHTGAAMASALLTLGRLPGVHRPGIGAFFPTGQGVTFIIDVGANIDCKPRNLLQFGMMGSTFISRVVGVEQPKVALLSIGEERSKGNDLLNHARQGFEMSRLNFIGNIEGGDILKGAADVVVCDGFVGNILLKFAESVSGILSLHMRKYIGKKILSNIGAFLLKPTFQGLKKIWNYEEYGGVPLLGINGVVIIGHGRSTPKAVTNAIREAAKMVESDVNGQIKNQMQTMSGAEIVPEEA